MGIDMWVLLIAISTGGFMVKADKPLVTQTIQFSTKADCEASVSKIRNAGFIVEQHVCLKTRAGG